MTTRGSWPDAHPIETESYSIMESLVDFNGWTAGALEVVKRMVHATADESFSRTALVGDDAVGAAVKALRTETTVVCDSRMVAAGVPGIARRAEVVCYLERVTSHRPGSTRSAAAIELAASEHPVGAIWVIGNAPTALIRLLELHGDRQVAPAAVIALPVGYVGAAESKRALWRSPLARISVTNTGRRGGSPVAAAALNALARLAWP